MEPVIVLKIGGSVLEDGIDSFAGAVAREVAAGRRVVVVHGGGKAIDAHLNRLRRPSVFVDGLRVTDEATLEVVEMTLSGTLNKRLARALIAAGVQAVGLSGTDGPVMECRLVGGGPDRIDLGRVGRVKEVHVELLESLLDAGCVPVLSPVSLAEDGQAANVNADAAAGAVAAALGGELRLLTDVAGVLEAGSGGLVTRLHATKARSLRRQGVLHGGMIPKVDACVESLRRGAAACRIQALSAFLDGQEDGTQVTWGADA